MSQPFGSESNSQSNYVCRIHQSLSYRVKQSPRLWFKKFNSFMLTQAYSPSLHYLMALYTSANNPMLNLS